MTAPAARPARRPFGEPSQRPGLPEGLSVEERVPEGGWDRYRGPVVILVHGSLDRASSFARTALRLSDLAVVAYDRRGYQGSREAAPATGLGTHIDDLSRIAHAYAGTQPEPSPVLRSPGSGTPRATPRPVAAVGHSVGGTVVLGAAVRAPELFVAVGAYEPTMPWLGFHRPTARTAEPQVASDGEAGPGDEAERFFKRMVGKEAWDRLPAAQRASRRADSPALRMDLRAVRGSTPFDVTSLRVPAIVASGGTASFPHHRQTAEWLAEHVPGVRWTQVPDAAHGAHLSHPDAFAALVRAVLAAGGHLAPCD
ncbi:MAG: alpha/beta fold hydrolase [Acidimicrobiales bacterium]